MSPSQQKPLVSPRRQINSDLSDSIEHTTSNAEIVALVNQVKAFDFEMATTAESAALTKALRMIALDTIARHESILALEEKLTEQLALASCAAELAGVVDIIHPRAITRHDTKEQAVQAARRGIWPFRT